MTREDILRMALEAGFLRRQLTAYNCERIERFATMVAAAAQAKEREACAQVCDAVQKKNEDDGAYMWEARNCATAIRARSNT